MATNGKVLDFSIDVDEYDLNFSESINPNSSSQNLNYNSLINKPQINNIELTGNKTAESLGLATLNDIPTIPVQSVNGKTGAVNLTAVDVGAKPDSYQAPVSSVAGKTGAVTLGAEDIGFDDFETYQDGTVGAELSQQSNAISQKQDAPSSAGTAGQVLGLDSNLDPVWVNQSGGGDVSNCAPIIINTASGDVASFADGADNRQIRKIVGTIEPVQEGTGDPAPDNVRPISGWTGANIYNEETYDASATPKLTINWQTEAGTIYNGHFTLNEDRSVDLYSDWVKREISTFTDISVYGNNRFKLRNWSDGGYDKSGGERNLLCDVATVKWANENYTIYGQTGTSSIFFRDDTVTTVSEFTAKYAGCYIAYESYKHTYRYHFDNIGQLYTYFGANNIWIDTGAITECDYPADTKLYVDGLTAPDEDMIANANIASGKYFVVNNQLYLSTAAIAAGASIVPGTNCTATNLAEALNALNT